jgi:formate dehydrogenase beta subunit
MCTDRVSVGLQPACVKACPTSALQFGTKEDMLSVANTRVEHLKANGFAQAAIYDPPGVGGTSVVTVLAFGDQPELYGLPRDPTIPAMVRLWKGPLKWLGNVAMIGGMLGVFAHYLRFGRKARESQHGLHTGAASGAGHRAPASEPPGGVQGSPPSKQ